MLFGILLFSCEKDDDTFIPNDELKVETRAPKNKVKLCHTTGNGSWHVISVNQNAIAAHVAHGDIILDEDGDGFVKQSPCAVFDCDDTDPDINPSAEEVNDGVDNDCDGVVDDGAVLTTYYKDNDEDGYGDPNNSVEDYTPPSGYVDNSGDCDDTNSNIYPGAPELIDGIDNDCDGVIDGGVQFIFYLDNDLDGYGDPNNSIQAYVAPPGYVEDNTDCNDSDASVNPAEFESWYDGIDQNCDGLNDYDQDGDGYVSNNYPGEAGGTAPNTGDCDDTDTSIHPDEVEVWYDGVNQNCDGLNDFDQDGDGYVSNNYPSEAGGTAPNTGDCDDTNASINPGEFEICDDSYDNDCDTYIDCGDSDCNGDPTCQNSVPFDESIFCIGNLSCDMSQYSFTHYYYLNLSASFGFEQIVFHNPSHEYSVTTELASTAQANTWTYFISFNTVCSPVPQQYTQVVQSRQCMDDLIQYAIDNGLVSAPN